MYKLETIASMQCSGQPQRIDVEVQVIKEVTSAYEVGPVAKARTSNGADRAGECGIARVVHVVSKSCARHGRLVSGVRDYLDVCDPVQFADILVALKWL